MLHKLRIPRCRAVHIVGILGLILVVVQLHSLSTYMFLPGYALKNIGISVMRSHIPSENITLNSTNNHNLSSNLQSSSALPNSKQMLIDMTLKSSLYDLKPRVLNASPWTCQSPPWMSPNSLFHLGSDNKEYFHTDSTYGSLRCFKEGTANHTNSVCTCKPHWHGTQCSIPEVVWYTTSKKKVFKSVKPIFQNYRRIIHAFPFNIEFDMLDARISQLQDVVDVFLILESNITAFGYPKPLRLLNALKQGYYNNTSCKIVHVFLDTFPKGAKQNGWIADDMHRNYIAKHGLVQQVSGYREDDIFLLTDADEIPMREVLLFLKLHEGYPEPVSITYKPATYGFFWAPNRSPISLPAVVSIGVLTHILELEAIKIRSGVAALTKKDSQMKTYLKSHNNTKIYSWSVGNKTHPAGWHCSWCFSPAGIQNKLVSAQNGDFPRWGDYLDKIQLSFIETLVRKGLWFDNVTKFNKLEYYDVSPDRTPYAPKYFLDHFDIYKSLLLNPYLNK